MVVPNRERIDRALIVVRDGIRPGCELAWKAKYGDDWLSTVHAKDKGPAGLPDTDDVAFYFKGMLHTWMEVWKRRVHDSVRNYVGELKDFRNEWAHMKQFSSDDTYRMLDTAERLLQAFSAAEHVSQIQAMKKDHQRQVFDVQARDEKRKAASKATEGEPLRGLSPWREIITPHDDVATGRFEQAEFAADLYQVAAGLADDEYQDPTAFFRRTYLTSGLKDLLVKAGSRLSGKDGDPVIDLQTNFGGGKTHSMIALYHLASGIEPSQLGEVGQLFAENDIVLPKGIRRAVLVGQMLSPSSPRVKEDGVAVNTLWGEIAYQLAGRTGYDLVRADDEAGTNPGDNLVEVLRMAGPSVILIDEWVAYARQLPSAQDDPAVVGGSFDTQFTFAQNLTESAARVPNVVVLISIPASDIEIGGEQGQEALKRLSNVVKRVSKQWTAASDDESFEIVRRRLFEPISPDNARKRDAVIQAFWDYYREKSTAFPSEVTEADYKRRMELSYPIHPELFDRLYTDWSSLERFQRTRGVLRLMAGVISALWQKMDQNLLIMPGNFPLDDPQVSAELLRYLENSWEPVVRSDVDGPNSLPLKIDNEVKNLGRYSATRRIARAVFLASAPRPESNRGVSMQVMTLGTAQPGESPGSFEDAAKRLSESAVHLNVDGKRYWYSTDQNINRVAADRANANFPDGLVDDEIRRRLQTIRQLGPFQVAHVFPDGPGDVNDDDDGVHFVILPMTASHVPNTLDSAAIKMAETIVGQRNAGPRINRNLLVFTAATDARIAELRTATRLHLAWKSIDADRTKLDLTESALKAALAKIAETNTTIEQRVFETFQTVFVPEQTPGNAAIAWHVAKITAGTGSLPERAAKKLESEEKVISRYSGARIRMDLDRIPLWSERQDITVSALWKAYCQFPYLPRLASRQVLYEAIADGTASTTWSEDTFAYAEGYEHDRWVGLKAAERVSATPGGLLLHPNPAKVQIDTGAVVTMPGGATTGSGVPPVPPVQGTGGSKTKAAAATHYYGTVRLTPVRAIRELEAILQNVVDQLSKAPGASLEIAVDISATSTGYDEQTMRVVRENATQLKFTGSEFSD